MAGGHTLLSYVSDFGSYEILGSTRDDAAGEAFDKVARLLRLGYPGGPLIDLAAEKGNEKSFVLPSPMIHDASLDFSYAGLKTAVWRLVKSLEKDYPQGLPSLMVSDIAASFRRAAVKVLVEKLFKAASIKKVGAVVLGGGVAANQLIRSEVTREGAARGLRVVLPSLKLCTDNAVGTAVAAFYKFRKCGGDDPLTLKHYRERPLMNW